MNFRLAISALITLLLLAGIHLYIFARNISLKYQITGLKMELNELNSQRREMGAQTSKEENLSQVEKIARERLGMIYPEKITYITPGQK